METATVTEAAPNIDSAFKAPLLAIVVPTYNEADNVEEVVRRVGECMGQTPWEIIFVDDDSPDGTADAVRQLSRRDQRVRCIHRIGRRGLSSACIEGMQSTAAPLIAVMDADLQHDERLLPEMVKALQPGEVDAVVGTRYMEGGSVGEWDDSRQKISQVATKLGQWVLKVKLSDPMSGFFMLKREVLHETVRELSGVGFKILLDISSSTKRQLNVVELPFTFRERYAGESKLDSAIAWEYLVMLLEKTVGKYLPVRFVVFSLVGSLGVVVHISVLTVLFQLMAVGFASAQIAATMVAMTFNFLLNNFLTYRDMRLRGWKMLRGWCSFVLACSVGAFANVGIAIYLFEAQTFWVLSAVAGILVGAVWNYAVTAVYTWKAKAKG